MLRNAGSSASGPPREIDCPALFEDAAARWRDFKERVGPSIAAAVNFAQVIAESKTFKGDKMETLKELREVTANLVMLDQETNDRADVCNEVRRRIVREAHYGEPTGNDADLYRSELAKRQGLRSAVEHAEAGRYLRDIDSAINSVAGENNDDELVVASGRMQVSRCPITGRELELPVANKTCGHVYSTAGIIGYIWQKNGRKGQPPSELGALPEFLVAACPNAGCGDRVTKSTLARDFVTERSQRLGRLGTNTQQSAGIDDTVEVDDLVDE